MTGNKGRWIGGSILVTVGVLFMLQQWGFLHFNIGDLVSIFWPLILLFVGVSMLVSGTWAGLIVLGIGGFFLLSNLEIIHMSLGEAIRRAFPLIIIAIGLIVLFGVKGKFKSSKHKEPEWNPSSTSTEWKKPEYEDPFADYVKNLNAEQHPISNDVDGYKEDGGINHLKMNIPKPPQPPKPPHYKTYNKKNDFDDELDLDFDMDDDDYDYDDDYSGQGDYDYKTYKKKLKHAAKKMKKKKGRIEKSCFIGDIHLGHDYWELRPANVSNFVGDTIIDLTKAQVPYGKTIINVSSFIGDVKVYVPNDMDLGVFVSSHSFLGDMKVFDQKYSGFMRDLEAKTPFFHESSKKVLIEVNSFIGDVKVIRVG
ncbi:cell wall-active antibiotics response protein LiaF [Paenibacillus arenosi]|uniref:Cell wall-active antibiotics response protein n=1 Tax=Paenibacillus arenosi TaxID=2774142 RepID=A0ABR9B080_9BACL|nr:cell wall-active antibiotics response protein LiaF [Paenibacillus arenosi]MBD8499817.1 cell wall-active antibiotics response protein [Paenibacillus arenosi]